MITAVVLAAGAGERLGGPKALANLAGRPLLTHVVDTCRAAGADAIVVVTGAEAAAVEALAGELAARAGPDSGCPIRVARNGAWRQGRTGSVQTGWRAAAPGSHVLLFPVDHPAVSVQVVDAMLGVFGYAAATPRAVVPVVPEAGAPGGRRRGHPVLLAAGLREAVLALPADAPLHDVVRAASALEVPVDDRAILLNVDTPAALAEAARRLAGWSR